jgi:hypothetical protein
MLRTHKIIRAKAVTRCGYVAYLDLEIPPLDQIGGLYKHIPTHVFKAGIAIYDTPKFTKEISGEVFACEV